MRRKPYTEIGIRRVRCYRCGSRAATQWQICADDSVYRGICLKCDIELNELVLRYMGLGEEEIAWKMDRYRERMEVRYL